MKFITLLLAKIRKEAGNVKSFLSDESLYERAVNLKIKE